MFFNLNTIKITKEEEEKQATNKRRRTLVDGPVLDESDTAFGDIFEEGNVKGW